MSTQVLARRSSDRKYEGSTLIFSPPYTASSVLAFHIVRRRGVAPRSMGWYL